MSRLTLTTLVTVLLLAIAACADAAAVRTLDGQFHEGEVKLEEGNVLTVQPANGGEPVKVELSNLLSADFRAPSNAPPPAMTPRWTARDIGTVAAPGTTRFNNNAISLRAAGSDIGGTADAGQFVVQSVTGDAQIVARVTSLQQSHPLAKAVLTFRASLDPTAPNVAVVFQAAGNVAFQHRSKPGANTTVREGGASELPIYLKLARRGNTFTASLSPDGEHWSSVGSRDVTLPATAYDGLGACSHADHAVTGAAFDNVSLTRTLSLTGGDGGGGATSRGVVFRNGSVLTGQVRAVDTKAVSMSRPREPNLTIPLGQVSRVFFAPLTADVLSRLPADRAGVLLANGDFVEGEILDLSGSRVKLSSVLFGIKRFETKQVAVAAYRAIVPASTRFHLRATDGSSLLCDGLDVGANGVRVRDPLLAAVQFPLAEIAEVGAGPRLVTSLMQLKPIEVRPKGDAPGYAVNTSLSGGPLTLMDRTVDEGLAIKADTELVYELEGSFSRLTLQIAVPLEAPRTQSIVFSVIVDGKEAYKSDARTSAMPPVPVSVDVSGTKRFAVRVAAEPAGTPSGGGILVNPVLIRNNRAD